MRALDYPWWLASRAAGVTAYLLLSLAVIGGLVMALRLTPPRLRVVVRAAHERIALLALAFVAVHGLLLLGDSWLKASLTDVLVPFHMAYRPVWTGFGILAAYSAAALSLTYYARRRLGARRWRHAHRFIPIAWAMAAVHAIGAGTDSRSLWLLAPIGLTAAVAAWLLADRWLSEPEPPAPRRPAQRPRPRRPEVEPPAGAPAPAPETAGSLWAPPSR